MTDPPEHLDLRSQDIAEDKAQELLRLFPEIRTEGGRLDFDRLKLTLGEAVDVGKERFGLTWPGKADCFRTIQMPSLGTLRPIRDESVNFDDTENLVIEGDNLEVLKLLQKSYLGKVKMIYIDPPYNTGNDFIYPDNYAESLQTYLEYTGQVDAEGKRFSTNTETEGRFHSKWMTMMYPRLYLARNLLREDGVIFISIDSGELANLLAICSELFGEENQIEVFSWVRTTTPAALAGKTKKTLEYVVCYERTRSGLRYQGVEKPVQSSNPLLNRSNPVGTLVFRAGTVSTGMDNQTIPAGAYGTDSYAVELLSDAVVADRVFASDVVLRGRFRWSQEYLESQLTSGVRVSIATNRMIPSYEKDSYGREALPNLIDAKVGVGTNETASSEMQDLLPDLGQEVIGQMHPKPVSLIRYLTDAVCGADDIVLDFFAGSGTTAQAVLELNREAGTRRFILVQLPEPTGHDAYPTIAEITKERVRRVVAKLADADADQMALPAVKRATPGFRVFELAESNFTPWNADMAHDTDALEEQLELHVEHVRAGRTPDDLLYEILLKSGFELTPAIERLELGGATVHSVDGGALLVCLDRELTLQAVRAIAARKPERVVCLDEGFAGNDQLKANAVQIFKTQGVTSFRTA